MAYTANIIPTMTSATAPSGVASASTVLNANLAGWKAFDHINDAYGWATSAGALTGQLQYQFPAAHVITQYAITSCNEPGYVQPPRSWMFQGSNDGTTWVTLDTQTNVTNWANSANVRKVFAITNTTAYAYGRLDITACNDSGPGFLRVGELEMMETEGGGDGGGTVPLMTDHYSRMRRG